MSSLYNDAHPRCEGSTAPRYNPLGELVEPSRRCRIKARPGRRHCVKHEPDREFREACQREKAAKEAERDKRRKLAATAARQRYEALVRKRLEELSSVTLMPDPNPHRCPAVCTVVYEEYAGGWDGEYVLPELVRCDGYRGHTDYDHRNGAAHCARLLSWRE